MLVLADDLLEAVLVGDVALDEVHLSDAGVSSMMMRMRYGSPGRSYVVTGTPSSTSRLTAHDPMQPSAPVTRKRSDVIRYTPIDACRDAAGIVHS